MPPAILLPLTPMPGHLQMTLTLLYQEELTVSLLTQTHFQLTQLTTESVFLLPPLRQLLKSKARLPLPTFSPATLCRSEGLHLRLIQGSELIQLLMPVQLARPTTFLSPETWRLMLRLLLTAFFLSLEKLLPMEGLVPMARFLRRPAVMTGIASLPSVV